MQKIITSLLFLCVCDVPFYIPQVVMILLTMPVGITILIASAINPPVGIKRANRTYGIAEYTPDSTID